MSCDEPSRLKWAQVSLPVIILTRLLSEKVVVGDGEVVVEADAVAGSVQVIEVVVVVNVSWHRRRANQGKKHFG